ncbi:hypothetical protein ABIA27_002075 [Sinorhizobium fredii]
MPLKQPNDVGVVLPESPRDRRVAVNFRMTGIGSLGEQKRGEGDVIFFTGHHQRCHACLIGRIVELRAVVEQQLGNGQAAGIGRGMKRGKTA